ncbi:hypothetical protein OJF2_18920 [Aquisphaera giovannonii]|uniref:Uncharacterized protein n=1 Tax=Aquisphaera giovannonii TaxID=406548 RepID=A0A5B9VZJ0_9BACT|nr:hypothetical protein [Aquisphaera giovannonii]QEH33391.1 hypothetical protein OJF2_18920 [Aquisphaera giovannonii]
MEFYVPLGCRGFLFRLGTFVIGIVGGAVYRKAAQRRSPEAGDPAVSLALLDLLAAE